MSCGVGACTRGADWLWRCGYDHEENSAPTFTVRLCSTHLRGIDVATPCVVTGCDDPPDGTAQLRPVSRRVAPPALPLCGYHLRQAGEQDPTAVVERYPVPS